MSKPNIFMSYSRREVSFVNEVVDKLEDADFKVWLDYRDLIPGTPWATQIQKGLDECDVVVLVVSKASIASEYVELEWKDVLDDENKRIILAIFEAVDIPEVLEKYEWVDFRGSFKKGMEELIRQLNQKEAEEHPVPETGFKVPAAVWISFFLSLVIALYAIMGIWTIFLPWVLLPLPYRIFKRDYNYTQTMAALVMLPIVIYMTSLISVDALNQMDLSYIAGASILPAAGLFLMLRGKGMQRWGKPVATRPIFADPYDPDIDEPRAVPFAVDYAPEDRSVAEELRDKMMEYGHPHVEGVENAEAVFVVISQYKSDTEADPERQAVLPVILQMNDDIAPKLSKIQWIDFRRGLRHLDELAKLLPEPRDLLKALGVRPMGNQLVVPPVVNFMIYFLGVLGIFTISTWVPFFFQLSDEFFTSYATTGTLIAVVVLGALLGWLIYNAIQALIYRRGRLARMRSLIGVFVAIVLIVMVMIYVGYDFMYQSGVSDTDDRGSSLILNLFVLILGGFITVVLGYVNRHDLKRWFPDRQKKND